MPCPEALFTGLPAFGAGNLCNDGVYKLGMSAEKRWRRIQGFDHLAKVIDGVKFKDGVEVNSEADDSRSTT